MKVWNCSVDDPRFKNISPAQWYWYAEMIGKDREAENERIINSVEYLASFWNAKAVEQIRSSRRQAEVHNFPDDREFEERVLTESYKNDPIVQAVIKYRKMQDANYHDTNDISDEMLRAKKMKLPTDLMSLVDSIGNK